MPPFPALTNSNGDRKSSLGLWRIAIRLVFPVLVVTHVILTSGPPLHAQDSQRPNVLIVLMDDMGYSDPGFMGGEVDTPNIDRLASGGLRFTQCYNSARCCPSRASLITGLYPHQAGIGSFATRRPDPERGPAYLGHLNEQCVTFAEVLKTADYQTFMVGKWHMEEPGPIQRGFDQFYGYVHGYEQDQWEPDRYVRLPSDQTPEIPIDPQSFYATDAFSQYSLEFLRQARQQPDRPWLLYLCHSAIHFPVQAPRNSTEKYLPVYRQGWDQLRQQRFDRMQENGLAQDGWNLPPRSRVPVDQPDIANGYPGKPNPAWNELPADRREDLAHRAAISAAMLDHADQGIGRILADLESHQQLDNTLILFLSDNGACYEWGPFGFDGPSRKGETILHTDDQLATMGGPGSYHSYGSAWANLGNTPLRLYKHYCHEGGNCTPLVAHWPDGIPEPDRWVRQPIHLIDIMPTLCDIAGAEYPANRDGKPITPAEGLSLVPVFQGQTLPQRPLFSEHQGARSVRLGRWKAVWSKRMPEPIQWELYDFQQDRCETQNVADRYPEITKELASLWIQWAEKVKVYPFYEPESESGLLPTAPQIKQTPLEIQVEWEWPSAEPPPTGWEGVLIAQGGDQHGYSLHLENGQLVFSIRRSRKVTTTPALPLPVQDRPLRVTAILNQDGTMQLVRNDQVVASAKAGGLIPVQPLDGLSIGKDTRSAVGNYTAPFPFPGTIRNVQINGQTLFPEP